MSEKTLREGKIEAVFNKPDGAGFKLAGETKWTIVSEDVKKFMGRDKLNLQKGDAVEVEIQDGLCTFITRKGFKQPVKGDTKVDDLVYRQLPPAIPVDWEAKDRRIVRQNCLGHADALIETMSKMGLLDNFAPAQIMEVRHNIAKQDEEWVYRTGTENIMVEEETINE